MSFLKQKFNSVEVNRKEIRAAKDLTVGCAYPILEIKRQPTKFGLRLLVELKDFSVFLPARYAEVFSESEIVDFNQKIKINQEQYSLRLRDFSKGTADFEIV